MLKIYNIFFTSIKDHLFFFPKMQTNVKIPNLARWISDKKFQMNFAFIFKYSQPKVKMQVIGASSAKLSDMQNIHLGFLFYIAVSFFFLFNIFTNTHVFGTVFFLFYYFFYIKCRCLIKKKWKKYFTRIATSILVAIKTAINFLNVTYLKNENYGT